ncbi:EsaK [Pseudomonas chlororaphis]|uniref:EsaK n=1 Tax=Pseudomonas chlororaphis TaxID=587753 RepID=UPI0011D06B83|nr:EsaK [Pseudomonas chlororaphis]
MNPLNIPCIALQGSTPQAMVIPAAELAQYFNATSALALARAEAEALQRQARECLAQAEEEARQIRIRARDQGIAEAANEGEALRQRLIEETLDWHVAETALEATLAQHLDTRLRALVAQVLEEFIGEQDGVELMVRRVRQRLLTFLAQGALTLRVCADCEQHIRHTFADYPQVQVLGSSSLATTQALLETHLFTLRIDLDAHLQSLLSRLRQVPHEPPADDYQDRLRQPQADSAGSESGASPPARRHTSLPSAICP